MFIRNILPALLLAACLGNLAPAECDRSPLLIRNVSVWTGTRLLHRQDVLFRDGRVAKLGRNLDNSETTRTINGSGDTLLPGLLDLHLHFVIPGLPKATRDFEVAGRQLLRSGVTAGRLHLASIEQAVEFKRLGLDDCIAMPRIQAAGPGLGGGAPNVNSPAFTGVINPEDARAKVERAADAGLEWVAVHDIQKFSEDERKALFGAATRRRLRVFTAAMSEDELREALRWPINTLDYIDRTPAPGYSPSVLNLLRTKRHRLAAVPTIGIFTGYAAFKTGTASLDDPSLYEFLSASDAEQVRSTAKRDLASNQYVADSAKFVATLRRKLHDLISSGVPVAIGTDVGSPAQLHPGAVWREMEAWRNLGVAPEAILRAATSIPSGILAQPDIGHLEPGARADFVLYRGHITEGPLDPRRVKAVGKGGVLFVSEGEWTGSR